jgi:NIPSNAP
VRRERVPAAEVVGGLRGLCRGHLSHVVPRICIAQGSARIGAMKRRTLLQSLPAAALLPTGDWLGSAQDKPGSAPSATTVYELRIYHVYEGKLDDLLRRFRDHTTKLFEKHGIKNVAYWTPTDEPLKGKTLVYILAHPSREAATANWKAFGADPEWQSVKDKSEANGKLVEKIDSTFMMMTDFSPKLL